MNPSDVRYIVIHTAATKANQDIGAADIDRWHRERGWRKIGYHFVIRRDGTVETGRHVLERGAHVRGYNDRSVGVCLVGGLDENRNPENNYTSEQWINLLNLLHNLRSRFPTAEIVGHRDLSPDLNGDGVIDPHEWTKVCPCFDVAEKLEEWNFYG